MSQWKIGLNVINSIEPHPNADKLEIATITQHNYIFVVPKDQFKIYDKVFYVPEGSIITDELKEQLSLPSNKVSMAKIRGIISQGLLLDPKKHDVNGIYKEANPEYTESEAPLPNGVKKYDIENAENFPNIVEYMKKEYPIVITEKLEGTNCSFALINGTFYVNSHNKNIPTSEDSFYGQMANLYDVKLKLKFFNDFVSDHGLEFKPNHPNNSIIIWGEIIGPKIQKNIYKLDAREFRVFDIMVNNKFLSYPDIITLTTSLNLKCVPLISIGDLPEDIKSFSDGYSLINNNVRREGIVIKPMYEINEPTFGRVILKQRSPEYLAKNK